MSNNIRKKFFMWQNGMCITYLTKFNQIESFFIENGCKPVPNVPEADIVIIGACASFLPYFDAYKERISMVLPHQTVIVYGCIPIVDQNFFQDSTPKISLFIPPRSPERITEVLPDPKVSWEDIEVSSVFRMADYTSYDPAKKFIVIQEGCNEKCIHCPHRVAIGKEVSYPKGKIISQIRRDISRSAKCTFVLEGENSGAWGSDLVPSMTYADLLKDVLAITGSCDIHLSNISPKWLLRFNELFIHPRITDIKIPIQTTSSRLLSVMGRDTCVCEIAPLLRKMRKANNKLTLRTEIIIGYPTSTEKELMNTLEFVSRYFQKVACFSFDYFSHTEIASRGIPILPDAVVKNHVYKAMAFFNGKRNIEAIFDDRGKICAGITK